jgi:hypothetical protein
MVSKGRHKNSPLIICDGPNYFNNTDNRLYIIFSKSHNGYLFNALFITNVETVENFDGVINFYI